MFSFITGVVREKANNTLVLDCNGVGFEFLVSNYSLEKIKNIGEVTTVYSYMHVREDAIVLFGFSSKSERELFLKLITVSGVGAKTAIAMLSGINPQNLINAITLGDTQLLSSIRGIGKKTSERIIVELKGSLGDLTHITGGENFAQVIATDATSEAIDALVAMGLTRYEAAQTVAKVANENDTTEIIIEKSLRNRG